MNIKLSLILAIALIFGSVSYAVAYCGLRPLKPLPPLGCRDLVLVCTCDISGANCNYSWVCVQ